MAFDLDTTNIHTSEMVPAKKSRKQLAGYYARVFNDEVIEEVVKGLISTALHDDDSSMRHKAQVEILNRRFGKPAQYVEKKIEKVTQTIDFTKLTNDQLAALDSAVIVHEDA